VRWNLHYSLKYTKFLLYTNSICSAKIDTAPKESPCPPLNPSSGEIEGELIGNGVVAALSLINNLEINEEILYGRMENIEQSTLIT
jgi:hypothetical protein